VDDTVVMPMAWWGICNPYQKLTLLTCCVQRIGNKLSFALFCFTLFQWFNFMQSCSTWKACWIPFSSLASSNFNPNVYQRSRNLPESLELHINLFTWLPCIDYRDDNLTQMEQDIFSQSSDQPKSPFLTLRRCWTWHHISLASW
jgi:hypothetical protein